MSSRNIHFGENFPMSLKNVYVVEVLKHKHILPGQGKPRFKFHHVCITELECSKGNRSFLQVKKLDSEASHRT